MTRLQARKHADLEESPVHLPIEEALADPRWLDSTFSALPFPGSGAPLVIEIGLGKDDHLIHRALEHPDECHVGFEYSRKKIEKFIHKAETHAATRNLRVLRADATRVIGPLFAAASLKRAYILFPDPWPKKRHHKKRIVQPAFIELLASKLAPGAVLELRTDHPAYASQMLEVLEACAALENQLGPGQLAREPRSRAQHVPTIFERKFRDQGLPLHYLYYQRQ